jgi:mono/diheme cytochrome c family protein
MQPFGEILDDETLAEIISYIRTAWGNDVIIRQENLPLAVSPLEIKKIRGQFHLN